MKNIINIPVTVLSMGFGRDLRVTPRAMEYQGQRIEFVDSGVRATVKTGNTLAQILALSDGRRTFRLRSDNHGGSWTLLSIA